MAMWKYGNKQIIHLVDQQLQQYHTQHLNNITFCPSSTIPSFLLENLGMLGKMKWWESKPRMNISYRNFIATVLSNKKIQKQGNVSYPLLHNLFHFRTILKDQQHPYHHILHFVDNDIQVPTFFITFMCPMILTTLNPLILIYRYQNHDVFGANFCQNY